jgi:hypothetical protein
VHDDPERRALAKPRHDVAARAGCAGTSRLAQHAGGHDEPHVRHEVVRCVARARKHTRSVRRNMVDTQPITSHSTPEALARAPADAPVTRIEFPGSNATPNRMCAMSAVTGSAARSCERPRHTTLTIRVAAT